MEEIAESLAKFYTALQKHGMPERRAFELTQTQFVMMLQKFVVGSDPGTSAADISKTIEKMLGLDKKGE